MRASRTIRHLASLFSQLRTPDRVLLGYVAAVAAITLPSLILSIPGCTLPTGPASQPLTNNAGQRTWNAPAPAAERPPFPAPRARDITAEPLVRVRIARNEPTLTLANPAGLVLTTDPNDRSARPVRFASPITVTHTDAGFRVTDATRAAVDWPAPALYATAADQTPITLGEHAYPQTIALHRRTNADDRPTHRVDAVNHVPLETYIPGVIQKELYGHWDLQAFRAQAIAARSYFFYEAYLNRNKTHDLESTTASQAYTGEARNPTAVRAAQTTRGLVLTYQGRVLPTFYSSTSGGVGADAHLAFDYFPDVAPLRGRDQGDWGRDSPTWRWTVTRTNADLVQRFAAYGKANDLNLAGIRGLRGITVTHANAVGRPAVFRITDTQGHTYDLRAEPFRNACNYTGQHLSPPGDARLRSAFVSITVGPASTRFDGRGFGHGVGMCQYSAQAMALAGNAGESIVSHFYPGATLQRLY